jgi:hypothetical protein
MHRRIAQCAIDHYHLTLPSNNGGKPQTGREWTVYAAIVAYRRRRDDDDDMKVYTTKSGDECDYDRADRLKDQDDMWVVSCATGSKCTSIRSIVSSLPRPRDNHDNEAHIDDRAKRDHGFPDMDEVSICKCYNGLVLKDSHAETLARRGLMSCLWGEIEYSLKLDRTTSTDAAAAVGEKNDERRTRQLLEACDLPFNKDDQGHPLTFRLKCDISLHMYVSDSPCGDASIYKIRRRCDRQPQNGDERNENEDTCDTELNFTGAKIILSVGNECHNSRSNGSISSILTSSFVDQESTGDVTRQSTITLGREGTQQLGALRIKSSRSNMPPELRSASMSCSDKLLRWGVFGLQGSLLAMYIPGPIRLSSICVSKDPRSADSESDDGQLAALKRALSGRIESVLKTKTQTCGSEDLRSPDVAVVDLVFESSKTASDYRHLEWQINMSKRSMEQSSSVPNKRPKLHGHTQDSVVQNESQNFRPQLTDNSKKESACGMSINWHQNIPAKGNTDRSGGKEATEITVGATGLKRGKKAKTPKDVLGSASRLCRLNFLRRCRRCTELQGFLAPSRHADADVSTRTNNLGDPSSPPTEGDSYRQYKRRSDRYNGEECFNGPLRGYIRSGNGDDFILPRV